MPAPDLDTIVNLSKRRGFVFPASEIYGGLRSSWDYGHLGAELLRKKDLAPEFGRPAPMGADDGLHLRPGLTVAEAERRLIIETLNFTQNNKTRAAEMLGISLKTLHNKLKEYENQPQK